MSQGVAEVWESVIRKGLGSLHYDVDGAAYVVLDTPGRRYMLFRDRVRAFGDYGAYDVNDADKEMEVLAAWVDSAESGTPHTPEAVDIPLETARFLVGLPTSLVDMIALEPGCWPLIAEGKRFQNDDVLRAAFRQFHQPWAAYQLAKATGRDVSFARFTVHQSGLVEQKISEKQAGRYFGRSGSKLKEAELRLHMLGMNEGIKYIPSSLGDDEEEDF